MVRIGIVNFTNPFLISKRAIRATWHGTSGAPWDHNTEVKVDLKTDEKGARSLERTREWLIQREWNISAKTEKKAEERQAKDLWIENFIG
jgi:hypothetical protein